MRSLEAERLEAEREENKFLIFNLGTELYGSRLLEIKEVIKRPTIKPVPYMVRYFKGIINLRGQIVSVIDLREKFDIPTSCPEAGLILVVDTGEGHIGVIVDEIS